MVLEMKITKKELVKLIEETVYNALYEESDKTDFTKLTEDE